MPVESVQDPVAIIIALLSGFFLFFFPLCLFFVGGLIGIYREKKHYQSLARREAALAHITVTDLKTAPSGMLVEQAHLVQGSVVIASDSFKTFFAQFQHFFGGELTGLTRMLERARREALMRMVESAYSLGATSVCNVRFETSNINGGTRSTAIGGAEVIAYGTALIPPAR